MHLRYLHISDLHLTGQPKDEEGWAVKQFNQDFVTRSLIDAVEKLVGEDGLALDLIFISGDLAQRGKAEEYEVAEVFCRRLLAATKLPAERLFLVPGNHDVDRGEVKDSHIRRLYRFEKEDEITEVLGIGYGAVKASLAVGRKSLRLALKDIYAEVAGTAKQ